MYIINKTFHIRKFKKRFEAEIGHWEGDTNGSSKTVPIENTIRSTVTSSDKQVKESGFLEKAWESFRAEWHDGSAFATFRVDHTGSVDESFSSSTGESDLAATFNRELRSLRCICIFPEVPGVSLDLDGLFFGIGDEDFHYSIPSR
jgi:hypothetical protein